MYEAYLELPEECVCVCGGGRGIRINYFCGGGVDNLLNYTMVSDTNSYTVAVKIIISCTTLTAKNTENILNNHKGLNKEGGHILENINFV